MDLIKLYFSFIFFMWTVSPIVHCLECYACEEQDTNKDKCAKTVVQCEEHHDVCATEIKWELNPNWTPQYDMMHFIWKRCETMQVCEAKKSEMAKTCKRDWFADWACYECCFGDRCNYYVTMGATQRSVSKTLTVMMTILALLISYTFYELS